MLPHLFEKQGLGAITFSPLAYGLLTGKYNVGAKREGGRLRVDDPYIKSWLKKRGLEALNSEEEDEKMQENLMMYKLTRMEELAKKIGCSQA